MEELMEGIFCEQLGIKFGMKEWSDWWYDYSTCSYYLRAPIA